MPTHDEIDAETDTMLDSFSSPEYIATKVIQVAGIKILLVAYLDDLAAINLMSVLWECR